MARMARIVVPHHPHHVTQRGNRRLETFFCDEDYLYYLSLLKEWSEKADTTVWAYCLMPNHVHLILVPKTEDGLRATLGETHRRYTRKINAREQWTGHLWQSRFASFAMDEAYLLACVRYIELNPVRAGLVKRPQDWRWSSAKAHLQGLKDGLVETDALSHLVTDWRSFLSKTLDDDDRSKIKSSERTGRPIGSDQWIKNLETQTGKILHKKRPGPKSKITKPSN